MFQSCCSAVSIQPKPKTGLEESPLSSKAKKVQVSIQPKPKTGLEEEAKEREKLRKIRFNPAEAEDGFRRHL